MPEKKSQQPNAAQFLTSEQEEVLAVYIQSLDLYFEELKAAEKLQVEIETQHLRRILDI
ncbi:hypothetical protein ACXYMU_08425 [Pontibacter sp. CAU 1760]